VARILIDSVREYDVVARFGGEEFIILLPETVVEVAYTRAEEIRTAVENETFNVLTSVTPVKATISLGIASREQPGMSCEDIIHNADMALYHSKLKGRNRTYKYESGAFEKLFPEKEREQVKTTISKSQ
jgi:two-component system, cell cycle response regulator